MKLKTTLAVLALSLSLAPGMALAEGGCSGYKAKDVTASSCIPGSTWDETKSSCVANPTS